jgi:hypothetical protein
MSIEKKLKTRGILMLLSFSAVLVAIFMPLFKGQNGLDYLDSLFNSISKGSAYYIQQNMEDVKKYEGKVVTINATMSDAQQAEQTAKLFEAGGAAVTISGSSITVQGDVGKILKNTLVDADSMYANDGKKITDKYGYEERAAMYNWWTALKEMDKDLKRQKLFEEAKITTTVKKKSLETSYNYYGIEPQSIMDSIGLVVVALAFYVFYTLWYGFGIMYLFEGLGLKIGH